MASRHGSFMSTAASFFMLTQYEGMLSSLGQLKIEWPLQFQNVMSAASGVLLDVEQLQLECTVSMQQTERYYFRVFMVAVVCAVMGACFGISQVLPDRFRMSWPFTVNTTGTILQVLFIRTVMFSVAPFQCTLHPDGVKTVLKYPAVHCGSDDHESMKVAGACIMCFVALPFYLLCLHTVYRAPTESAIDKSFLVRFKFMFSRYRDDCYFFNACFLTFNLLFAATPAVLPADSPVAATLVMIILVLINLTLQLRLWPWKVQDLNYVYSVVLLMLAMILTVGIAGINGAPSTGGPAETLINVASGLQVASILFCIAKHVLTVVVFKGGSSAELDTLGKRLAKDWGLIVRTLSALPPPDHKVAMSDWTKYDQKMFGGVLEFLESQGEMMDTSDHSDGSEKRRRSTMTSGRITTSEPKRSTRITTSNPVRVAPVQ
jgi:hypothetical protein